MCLNPILIDNPYKGLKHVGLNFIHDCESAKIPVPCGHCLSCIALRQNYYIQRCQMESISNHLFMMTLTYKPSMIRYILINGRKLYYPDFTDVQKMFKRLRNRGLSFRYLVVSEYGSNNHRPHFHAIISVPKGVNDSFHDILNLESRLSDMFFGEWRRNYGSDKKPNYKDLCQLVISYRGRTYDFHYVNPALSINGESDVGFYVTKYVLKADKWVEKLKSALKLNVSPEKFIEIWKLLKPRICISKGFGDYDNPLVKAHIRKGIDAAILAKSAFPYFINPVNGSTFPLARTFQSRFLTLADKLQLFANLHSYDMKYEHDKASLLSHKLDNIRQTVNSRLTSYNPLLDDSEIKNILPGEVEKDSVSPISVPDDWSIGLSDSADC